VRGPPAERGDLGELPHQGERDRGNDEHGTASGQQRRGHQQPRRGGRWQGAAQVGADHGEGQARGQRGDHREIHDGSPQDGSCWSAGICSSRARSSRSSSGFNASTNRARTPARSSSTLSRRCIRRAVTWAGSLTAV
jgi:hypothetical protein